jgi:hypothetical protein
MTALVEVEGWAGALEKLVAGLASRFCRDAGVRRALSYLRGLLAPLARIIHEGGGCGASR